MAILIYFRWNEANMPCQLHINWFSKMRRHKLLLIRHYLSVASKMQIHKEFDDLFTELATINKNHQINQLFERNENTDEFNSMYISYRSYKSNFILKMEQSIKQS